MTALVSFDEGERRARLACSYTRLPTICRLIDRMAHEEWLALLGDWWSVCDNTSAWLPFLRRALPSTGPVRAMMNAEENTAWDALPERVVIYRGFRRRKLGASWSLERAVAARFPFDLRYGVGGPPRLVTAEVARKSILAIKLDRNEAEVIVLKGRAIISCEPLPEPTVAGLGI